MLQALIDGQRDPHILADLAKRRMRSKIPELNQALTGRFREHHAFLTRLYLDQYDQLSGAIKQLTVRIEEAMSPFRPALDLLDRLTPARVRRGFRNLRPSLPCPARLPKSSHPGPGRPLGSKNRRAVTRYDVGKTVKRPDAITERDQVRP